MNRLDRLVRDWAAKTPDKPAVEAEHETLSYGELEAMANRFAALFAEHGVRSGDRVGVHMHRSGRAIAAILGALRAGAVYVPLDPSSPPSRIALIARDCMLRHVVISPVLLERLQSASVAPTGSPPSESPIEHFYVTGEAPAAMPSHVAHVHAWRELESATGRVPELGERSPDSLAYILYTSGSTGVPKGVMLSHRNALSFVDWAAERIALSEHDRVASVAPFHFDLSVFDVWASLSRGATICIVDEVAVTSGRRMLDRIHAADISVWYSVPSALVLMLENGGLVERGAPSLRVVFFAGEVFAMKHLRRAMEAVPHARFLNLFGPTETNVCLAYELEGPPSPEADSIPIGHPACGDECVVLDATGAPAPPGEVGELFVNGPTVMLGYWDQGRRTPAARPYPTGDLVSRRADGAFLYHGRRDHMVKIHGHRVELGEVEAAVLSHARVREAVAMAIEQRLVVVAVPSDDELSVLELKQHCAALVPRYMVPTDIKLVDELPRTSNGKTDRVRAQAAVCAGDLTIFGSRSRGQRKER